MTEFKSSSGHTFVAGRNMSTGEADTRIVSWNDPATGEWETRADNEAGFMVLPFGIGADPAIEEVGGEVLVGATFKFYPVGKPFVWGMKLQDERASDARRA